ncbi:metallophosphatase family protein [Ulvibacter sp.]|nr:metallophosphatase family protein [Ulvibacter sp.]
MMIGIISDIHGNFEALKVVLAELDKKRVSKIYCLGDVVGYYSQVNECCEVLRERKIECLMGNHDWYMVSGSFCPRSQSVNDCLAYQRKLITTENFNWLKEFQLQIEFENIKMVHGGWTDPIDEYLYEPNEEYFRKVEGEIFLSGHTHKQQLHHFKNKTYCNPGSVGMPRDNDPRAAYAIIKGKDITLHRVDYNIDKVCDLMKKAGFNSYYYGGLKTGARNLRKP